MISSKRVDVLPHKWSDMALRFILNVESFGAQLSDNLGDMNHVPGHHGIVQDRKTAEGMDLIAKFAPAQHAFLAETQKPR